MTNGEDRVCRQFCEADHFHDEDVTRRGEIALAMTVSEACDGC